MMYYAVYKIMLYIRLRWISVCGRKRTSIRMFRKSSASFKDKKRLFGLDNIQVGPRLIDWIFNKISRVAYFPQL